MDTQYRTLLPYKASRQGALCLEEIWLNLGCWHSELVDLKVVYIVHSSSSPSNKNLHPSQPGTAFYYQSIPVDTIDG